MVKPVTSCLDRRSIVGTALCVACLSGVVREGSAKGEEPAKVVSVPDATKYRVEAPYRLTISPHGDQRRGSIKVLVKVVNTSKAAIGWDSEFCVGLNWMVRLDGEGPILQKETISRIERRDKPGDTGNAKTGESKPSAASRFVLIEPGMSLSKVVSLASSFKSLRPIAKLVAGGEEYSWEVIGAYEAQMRYVVPRDWTGLRVKCSYGSDTITARKYFGVDLRKMKMDMPDRDSNYLEFEFK